MKTLTILFMAILATVAAEAASPSGQSAQRIEFQKKIAEMLARGAYEDVLKLEPDNRSALSRLLERSTLAGDNQTALDCFQRLQRSDPSPLIFASYPLGAVALERDGRKGEAEALLKDLDETLKADTNSKSGVFSHRVPLTELGKNLRIAEVALKTDSLKVHVKGMLAHANGALDKLPRKRR